MISLNSIDVGYKTPLLSVNLSLELGNLYALVGKNGSGKTTLLQSIIGAIPTINGEILLDEKSIHAMTNVERAKKIAFVETKFMGISYLTGFEYVAIGRTPYTNALGRLSEIDKIQIAKSLEILNISYLSDKFTTQMSDGERQLLQIARALAQETPYILMDEPTAFLDYSNKQNLIEKLQEIAQVQQKCILLSCHDIEICLENKLPFLIVSEKDKRIELRANASKEDILKLAFPNLVKN
ncbi:MAG: ABC transporter ATP-binding protein [Crocinitomicaceae bacterium]|nr:ABC transporter ATP-binding protein [Crocinitomicaceae bacterium]MCF8410296.1 ABC transporter ATP-binding protein [Crocinitomicaceae bacterium]MCF8444908.1 ABC transporter ATP-binding protein [Crocinitomicaceae bacterium]